MKRTIILLLCGIFSCAITIAQEKTAQLLNLAVSNNYEGPHVGALLPPFVSYRPPKIFWSKKEEYSDYIYYIQEWKQTIDSSTLMDLVEQRAHLDSTLWTQQELQNAIVVFDDAVISFKRVKASLHNPSYSKRQAFKKAIREYNATPVGKRTVLSYTRPVFDKTKKYALIEFISYCGFQDWVYYYDGNNWIEVGLLHLTRS